MRLPNTDFLHFCLTTNRETLPLSLVIIFCALASRLGLYAAPCNFPSKIIAIVSDDPAAQLTESSASAPGTERLWVDVYSDGVILDETTITAMLGEMRLGRNPAYSAAATPASMVLRGEYRRHTTSFERLALSRLHCPAPIAARNVVRSVQQAQNMPRIIHVQPTNLPTSDLSGSDDSNADSQLDEVHSTCADKVFLFDSYRGFAPSEDDISAPHARRLNWVRTRATHWSEHDQQASMYFSAFRLRQGRVEADDVSTFSGPQACMRPLALSFTWVTNWVIEAPTGPRPSSNAIVSTDRRAGRVSCAEPVMRWIVRILTMAQLTRLYAAVSLL